MSTTTTTSQNTTDIPSLNLKRSLRLITSLIDTSPPVFYDARRRPTLRSVLSSPGGLSVNSTPVSSSRQAASGPSMLTPADPLHPNRRAPERKPTTHIDSPLTTYAPLDFPNTSPNSRTRAVSLVLPPPSPSVDQDRCMPVGRLQVRDKADEKGKEKNLLRPIPKRSSTISPEVGHHTWGSLPPPRGAPGHAHISPPTECLARFTLSPPTGTMPPSEYICESPSSAVNSPLSAVGGYRSGLARPCVSQIEVTSTWSTPKHTPMTTVDRVCPRSSLAKWEDRLSLPAERGGQGLRRSVSMRNGIRDSDSGGHKRNHSDSLLQNMNLPQTRTGDGGRMSYLAQRPAPPIPGYETMRPTTRRSRIPVPYSIGNKPSSGEGDRLSTLSRQTSMDSLASGYASPLRQRGRSGSVRDVVGHPSPVYETDSKPLGAWDRVREGASATARSRRSSFASIWSTSRISEVQTIKGSGEGDVLTRAAGSGLELEIEGDIDDLQTKKGDGEDNLDDDEVFIGFDDM